MVGLEGAGGRTSDWMGWEGGGGIRDALTDTQRQTQREIEGREKNTDIQTYKQAYR